MFKGCLVRRILALWLTLAIGWPGPVFALRAMTGQGAGVEELRRELAAPSVPLSGGLEEDGKRRLSYLKHARNRNLRLVDVRLWDHSPVPFMELNAPIYIPFGHFAWPHVFKL